MQRTVSIKTNIPNSVVLPLMEECASVFNVHSEWAHNNKTYNKSKAHKALYAKLRESHPNLPSAYIQSMRDNAMESIKGLWVIRKKHNKKKEYKRKFPTRKKKSNIRLDKRTCTLRGSQFSFSTLSKRHKVILNCPEYFKNVFENWDFQSASITYTGVPNTFFVRLVFKIDTPEKISKNPCTSNTLGVDRGIKNLCVLSSGDFFSGSKVNSVRRRYLHTRRTLQAKGTHSSKRRLKSLGRKEKRFIRDVNHCVTKKISKMPYEYVVLEKLTGIRGGNRGKKLNKKLSNWAYLQQELILTYKLEALGKHLVFVDARYTSQRCNSCGNTRRLNRDRGRFRCNTCGYTEHSDLNAAYNVRDVFLSHHLNDEQGAVNHPYATDS